MICKLTLTILVRETNKKTFVRFPLNNASHAAAEEQAAAIAGQPLRWYAEGGKSYAWTDSHEFRVSVTTHKN